MKMLVVESAAKARTIQKYLKDGWVVLATGGHVQDLPSGTEHGKAGRKASFAEGRDGLPNPPWVWTERGEQAMRKILERAEKEGITEFVLATDPDREGEFIAWRLEVLLGEVGKTERVTFHEVTIDAIKEALRHPRPVDMRLVESASVRKFLDRLVGFRTSKLARSYLAGGGKTSMGRVQTPTLGFVIERELEREAHVPIPYFELRTVAQDIELQVRFHDPKDADAWKDDAGKVHPNRTSQRAYAEQALDAVSRADSVLIESAKQTASSRKPKPPLATDALLQAAGNRWGWSPSRTMRVATSLYEAGHVTYIRTDSTRMAADFVTQARALVTATWGEDHLGPGAAEAKPTGKVQDAHEAIRPTRIEVAEPAGLEPAAAQLYTLIRARTLGSQMSPAQFARISLVCRVAPTLGLDAPLTGGVSWRTHPGWQAAFEELDKAPAEAPPGSNLTAGQPLKVDAGDAETPNPRLIEDATKPPGRYRAHTVVRTMKEQGIGRPSTYASTIETLKSRRYVEIEDGALVPTARGRAVWLEVAPLYEDEQDGALFSVEFTAEMEGELDRVETGAAPARDIWGRFSKSIRALHDAARGSVGGGKATPKRVKQLEALLEAAPPAFPVPADLNAVTQTDALVLIAQLRELGVKLPPSTEQLEYIRSMGEKLQLSDEQVAALVDLPNLEAVATRQDASALIGVVKAKLDEERPASPKQLGLVRSLAKKLELEEPAAAALVGAAEFAELTGGRSGTASALIDALRAQQKEAKAQADAPADAPDAAAAG